MSEDGYVIAVKVSARRVSAGAGEHVRDHGPRRRFDSRADAEAWARSLATDRGAVYVRDANPGDDAVDGYLMALGSRPGSGVDPGEQTPIPAFDPDNPRSNTGQSGLERYGDDLSVF